MGMSTCWKRKGGMCEANSSQTIKKQRCWGVMCSEMGYLEKRSVGLYGGCRLNGWMHG